MVDTLVKLNTARQQLLVEDEPIHRIYVPAPPRDSIHHLVISVLQFR